MSDARQRRAALRLLGKLLTLTARYNRSLLNMMYELLNEVHRRHDQSDNINSIIVATCADLLQEHFDYNVLEEGNDQP